MNKLGITHDPWPGQQLDRPRVPDGHPLERHVLYRLTVEQCRAKGWRMGTPTRHAWRPAAAECVPKGTSSLEAAIFAAGSRGCSRAPVANWLTFMSPVGDPLSVKSRGSIRASTATRRAAQISRLRASATRPRHSTRIAIETLSIESRLTAVRSGTGSSPGSRRTSLGRPRMVVMQGAMSARRWRGMTASRDRTTTGLRPISPISHHHASPREGKSVATPRPPVGTRTSLPIRRARRAGARRRQRRWRPLRPER